MASSAKHAGVSKEACRAGLPDGERRGTRFALGTLTPVLATRAATDRTFADGIDKREVGSPAKLPQHEYYAAALREVFGNVDPVPSKVFRIPFLGVEPSVLPEEATVLLSQPTIAMSAAHDRVICILAQLHGLRYCPQVPNLALLLLHFNSEAETFSMVEAMLRRNKTESYILLSKREETAFVKTFRTLVKSYFPQLSTHIEQLGAPVRSIFASWFRGFFTGWLPPEDVHKVVDAYLCEGPKVLLRFGLAFLKIAKRKLKAATSASQFDRVIRRWVASAVVSGWKSKGSLPSSVPGSLSRDCDTPDPLIPEKYTFALLSHTAYHGIAGLSRDTIMKLMDRYLNAARTPAGGVSAGFGGASDGSSSARGEASVDGSTPHTPTVEKTSEGADGETSANNTVTLRRSNSIVTVGHEGSTLGAASLATLRTLASSAERKYTSTTPAGVEYDDIGSAAADDASAPPVWYNTKIVGVGCRLMTVDFMPLDRDALKKRITRGVAQSQRPLFVPELALATGLGKTPLHRPHSPAHGHDGLDAGALHAMKAENNPSWLSGVYASVGRMFSSNAASIGTGTGAGASGARHSSGHHATITDVFGDRGHHIAGSHDSATGVTPSPQHSATVEAALDHPTCGAHVPPLHLPTIGESPPAGESVSAPTPTPTPTPTATSPTREVVAVAYSVASSPHLASLSTFVPERVASYNWTCVFSTDLHGWSLQTLYRKCAGLSPLLVLFQAGVKAPATHTSVPKPSEVVEPSVRSQTAARLATAVSSKHPVFGFYTGDGLASATGGGGGGGGSSARHPLTARHAHSGTFWSGTSGDFMFQLHPELNIFPVSNAATEARATVPVTGSGVATDVSYTTSVKASDLLGSGHRTVLHRDKFLLCTDDMICVGANPDKTGAQALSFNGTLETAVASREFLLDMSVPDAGACDDVPLNMYGVEVYAFLDRYGAFMCSDMEAASAARAAYRATLESFWVPPEDRR